MRAVGMPCKNQKTAESLSYLPAFETMMTTNLLPATENSNPLPLLHSLVSAIVLGSLATVTIGVPSFLENSTS